MLENILCEFPTLLDRLYHPRTFQILFHSKILKAFLIQLRLILNYRKIELKFLPLK